MEAKFKDLKFKTVGELNEWLKKVTHKVIALKDNGQDMQRIWVHKSGEILNCDFHASIYCGRFIDMEKISIGNPLNIWDDKKQRYVVYKTLVIEAHS